MIVKHCRTWLISYISTTTFKLVKLKQSYPRAVLTPSAVGVPGLFWAPGQLSALPGGLMEPYAQGYTGICKCTQSHKLMLVINRHMLDGSQLYCVVNCIYTISLES